MSTFRKAPRLQKGAIVGVDPFSLLASVVVFQCNPSELTRTLTARTREGEADKGETLRLAGGSVYQLQQDCVPPRTWSVQGQRSEAGRS
jgi:hypothetical protein